MPAKQGAVNLVDFTVRPEHVARRIHVAPGKALADTLQHLLQNTRHFNELFRVRFRQPDLQTLSTLPHPPEQVADAFEVSTESQTCKKLARFQFRDLCNR